MTLRAIPASMDPAVVATIDGELDRIERDHRVGVRLAIESGSRAWGFPSPDSDYDCRFVYVAHLDGYLTPWRGRDVIETPLVGLLDVNGWELAKALRLLVAGNAVLVEWLMSPIVYRGDAEFRDELRELAHAVADRNRIAMHYLHLGRRQWRLFDSNRSLKKVFYSLRPAMALRWLHEHPNSAVAPMHLPTLLEQCELPADLTGAVHELTELKSRTREMGAGAVPTPISDFITAEFDRAADAFTRERGRDRSRAHALTTEFFRRQALR
ncbi:nucleotidyltransferase domain-containing protein [Nocardia otitidiscaviarum]|uniref:nucleotidyltransferase domain-containing protein n=1 Tax=Nocardia otitidiscaviarum TaxID=1823 RepID=UPI0004A72420|nr:nucleotidyltransferase domain-containing protein [Nocardia otitidiscaviarum]MBF6132872.1 nucleotidyltransferase domain-containing protein [Nocardia otitidiscaviarum]MBF6486267.1 nucleotidyltransferase domain-containing protein [Nocardia otitidiscaviarum]